MINMILKSCCRKNQPFFIPEFSNEIHYEIELILKFNRLGKHISKDFAYEKDGHVLFHVPNYENYGKLSNRIKDEQIAGSRVDVADFKKDPADFVLWKPSTGVQPGWESPWGIGRPGWHTECSAMSEKTLGLPLDIHGGGRDLIFPHHENEIAQSCCTAAENSNPESYAKYWMHNGFVTIDGEKMSKSLGNIILVNELTQKYHGEVIRLALLSTHYRQALDWNDNVIHQAKKLLDKLYSLLNELNDVKESKEPDNDLIEILLDDLNTPGLMANINKLLKNAESSKEGDKPNLKSNLLLIGKLMGILEDKSCNQISSEFKDKVDNLIEDRSNAKKKRDFELADKIRSELIELGIEINDSPEGTTWKVVK